MRAVDDEIHHVQLGDREVKDWRLRSGYMLLYSKYDTEKDLRNDWADFQEMPFSQQRESDWKSIQLFDKSNKDRYEAMLSAFLKNDIDDELYDKQYIPLKESASFGMNEYAVKSDMVTSALTCMKLDESGVINSALLESTKRTVMDKIKKENEVIFPLTITPFFCPDELESIGLSYIADADPKFSVEPDNTLIGSISTKTWFDEYKNRFLGYNCSESVDSIVWAETLTKLYSDFDSIKESGNTAKINSRKQSILDLGWNPELPFNENTMKFATDRIGNIVREMYSSYSIADISDTVSLTEDTALDVPLKEIAVKPIFIVFFNSKTFFNKVVRVFTDSVYNHVAISFDPSLKTMYSFSGTNGGFSVETLKNRIDTGNDRAIQVFCIFVDPTRWRILQNKIANYRHNKDKFGYSFLNLATIPFKINYIDNTKMVCSQFVDSMLKLADLDFTKLGSNMISPGLLNKKMRLKKYRGTIYKIYTGPPSKYDSNRVKRVLGALGSAVGYNIKEGLEFLRSYVNLAAIHEAKDFPIQFSDDGDLLISKGKNLDFEGEYSRCHMALQQYSKAKNLEGMKYCLCKLWYLNIVLEENIHDHKNDKEKLKEYHRARAKIVNDITTYMKEVQKLDKNFDMLKEYQASPFNDDAVRIRRSTLLYSIDLFKRLIGVK